jgi:hypothetical protein
MFSPQGSFPGVRSSSKQDLGLGVLTTLQQEGAKAADTVQGVGVFFATSVDARL